jgi:hypothetical protein
VDVIKSQVFLRRDIGKGSRSFRGIERVRRRPRRDAVAAPPNRPNWGTVRTSRPGAPDELAPDADPTAAPVAPGSQRPRLVDSAERDIIDWSLSGQPLQNDILPDPIDRKQFEVIRVVLLDRVDSDEPLLGPINDHRSVGGAEDGRKVEAECGNVFCNLEDNWREHAVVRVRESREEFASVYTDW